MDGNHLIVKACPCHRSSSKSHSIFVPVHVMHLILDRLRTTLTLHAVEHAVAVDHT